MTAQPRAQVNIETVLSPGALLVKSEDHANEEMAPARPSERIIEVDIVRAIALIGIVIVNYQSPNLAGAGFASNGRADHVANSIVEAFFNGKFYPLFSLLFGFGMAVQLTLAQARGVGFVPFYLRRLAVLFLLGVVHSLFVWNGDILHVYAFWGLLLLACSSLSDRLLLIIALVLIGVCGTQRSLLEALHLTGASPHSDAASYLTASTYPMLISNLAAMFLSEMVRIRTYLSQLDIPGMFLIGLYAGRRGLLGRIGSNKLLVRRVMLAALAVGTLGVVWRPGLLRIETVIGNQDSGLYRIVDFLSHSPVARVTKLYYGQALAIFYCSALLLLLSKAVWVKWLRPLSSLGRMALTNYVAQCVVGAILFYGFDLYGRMGPAAAVLLAVGVYALQIPLSAWWLKRYRFGPLEWVWRSLTYGRLQPMKAGRVTCARKETV